MSERGAAKGPPDLAGRGENRRVFGGLDPSICAALDDIGGVDALVDDLKVGMLMPKNFFLGLLLIGSSRSDLLAFESLLLSLMSLVMTRLSGD